jgi:hypothetical protein
MAMNQIVENAKLRLQSLLGKNTEQYHKNNQMVIFNIILIKVDRF